MTINFVFNRIDQGGKLATFPFRFFNRKSSEEAEDDDDDDDGDESLKSNFYKRIESEVVSKSSHALAT